MSTVLDRPDKAQEQDQELQEPVESIAATALPDEEDLPLQINRPALAAGSMGLGTAFLIGGMFTGFMPRVFASVGAIAGVGLAVYAIRPGGKPVAKQIMSLVGIVVLGLLGLMTVGFGAVTGMSEIVGEAISNARLRRPPAFFEDGWRALLLWTMASISYASAYLGIVKRRPALGLTLPLPIVAFTAIAQPPDAQLVGGIVALLGFIVGLAIIHRADNGDEGGVPLSFELRRAARAAPLVIGLVVGLIFLGQADLLFPKPKYDPTQRAILPKAVPLSQVEDRPLFTVRTKPQPITGPWRTGVLDVYDGKAWRLPPFSASSLVPVAETGVLNGGLAPDSLGIFKIAGLEGTVLPTPARPVKFSARNAPALLTDDRTGTVRVEVGQVKKDFSYDIEFTALPEEAVLEKAPVPTAAMAPMLEAPPVPSGVQRLLAKAPKNPWKRLDALRKQLLETVAATGSGLPVEVPPNKVDDMFFGSKEGTPFEIVAGQALMARWAGIPARIGYGFDGGELKGGDLLEVRPKHGSLWLEVHFEGQGWLPVTGNPKRAKKSLNSETPQLNTQVIPSDDIAVGLFIPLKIKPPGAFANQIKNIVLLLLPLVLLGGLIWFTYPGFVKWRRRARRRQWAMRNGAHARIALAYADFRDMATDLGVGDPYATPLSFLDMVVKDDEHTELAWLVTRTIWGDLSDRPGDEEVQAAEELSRSLRRRLFEAQPVTIRAISLVSRLSLRQGYSPEITAASAPQRSSRRSKKQQEEVSHALA